MTFPFVGFGRLAARFLPSHSLLQGVLVGSFPDDAGAVSSLGLVESPPPLLVLLPATGFQKLLRTARPDGETGTLLTVPQGLVVAAEGVQTLPGKHAKCCWQATTVSWGYGYTDTEPSRILATL